MAAVTFMVADHLPARLKQTAVPEAFEPYGDGVERSIQALERLPGFTTAGAAADMKRNRAIGPSAPVPRPSRRQRRFAEFPCQAARPTPCGQPRTASPSIPASPPRASNCRRTAPSPIHAPHRRTSASVFIVMSWLENACHAAKSGPSGGFLSGRGWANASAPSFVRSSSGLNSLSATRRCHASSTSPAPLG